MTWTLRILRAAADDLARLDPPSRKAVINALENKLAVAPDRYGEPLRRELFGLWKLRVGDYRVIYRIDKGIVTVYVLMVGMRRNNAVYKEMLKRFRAS